MDRPSKRQRVTVSGQHADTAAAAASSVATAPPPHLRLHRHVLESIFALLTLGQLQSCSQVSPRWLEAVCSMRGIDHGKQQDVKFSDSLNAVLRSRMARHINDLNIGEHVHLTAVQLKAVCRCVPFLRRLQFWLPPEEENHPDLVFPATLSAVSVSVSYVKRDSDVAAASGLQSSVEALSHHAPLTELVISDSDYQPLSAAVSLAPLRRLDGLRLLTIEFAKGCSDEQLVELRTLTQLEELRVPLSRWPASVLLRLLQAPCDRPLQWTVLRTEMWLNDACATLLPTVAPHLQRLNIYRPGVGSPGELSSLLFLTCLPALTYLHVLANVFPAVLDVLMSTLPAAAVSLPRLTSLHWQGNRMDSAQMATVLACFPKLQELRLEWTTGWSDFTFLQPVRSTLHTLRVDDCGDKERHGAIVASLPQLADLPHLTSLALLDTCHLDADTLRALQPPSALLRSLTHFQYAPRQFWVTKAN